MRAIYLGLEVGDAFEEGDLWNFYDGLRPVPRSRIGSRINYTNPRDIFLRPVTEKNKKMFVNYLAGGLNPSA